MEGGPCDILLCGSMGDIGPEVKAALESHGLSVRIMDFKQNVFHDEFGYCRLLWKTIPQCNPRVIMPIGCPIALSRYKSRIPEGTAAAVEDEEKLRILDSKAASSRLASRLGIRQPRLYASPEDVPEGVQVVFKRDVSFGGHGVHLPWNRQSLLNLIGHQSPGEPYLIEDWIQGGDYSIDCMRSGGRTLVSCYKVLEHQGNGPSSQRRTVRPEDSRDPLERKALEEMAAAATRMLDSLDYHGICGMDFKVDSEGRAWFLECNPRFTGGISTQVEAGFDLPWMLYLDTLGKQF